MRAWTFLQLADSALPTGAFAHSGGLESAVQLGRVRDAAAVGAFLDEALWHAGAAALPFVDAAHAAPDRLATIDLACDAAMPAHVANAASRLQGQAFLRAAAAARPDALAPLEAEVRAARLPGHLAPVLGAALARLGGSPEETRHLFLFGAARGIASAAVRLGLVGPHEAQRLLDGAGPTAERVLLATAGRTVEEAAAASPLLDLVQCQQDRLYSRLFRS
jgi:urease accessory protein